MPFFYLNRISEKKSYLAWYSEPCEIGSISQSDESLQILVEWIEQDLELLKNWFNNNLLSFSVSKTKYSIGQNICNKLISLVYF